MSCKCYMLCMPLFFITLWEFYIALGFNTNELKHIQVKCLARDISLVRYGNSLTGMALQNA